MRNRECGWLASVAISVSESPDLHLFGLSSRHLQRAMETLASYLLSFGFRLAYGGDLREGGFTEQLFEIASRYDRSRQSNGILPVTDYLAWSAWCESNQSDLQSLIEQLHGVAEIKRLNIEGLVVEENEISELSTGNRRLKAASLTAMRHTMLRETDARVVLGGNVAGYLGAMPGIAEESLLSLEAGKPLYVLGGFGGCARDIAQFLGLVEYQKITRNRCWDGHEEFDKYRDENLNNGLNREENRALANTHYILGAVDLIVRGLDRVTRDRGNQITSSELGK